MENIRCPNCGYRMPIVFNKDAECKGVFIKCKGKKCKKIFEIKINKKSQVVPLRADDTVKGGR